MASTLSRDHRKQAHPSSTASAQNRECIKPTHPNNTPAFLSNLGKATLRGIRRCPQCGIYNGTRGLSCKNKACGIVLRDGSSSVGGRGNRKAAIDVVKVVIDGGDSDGEGTPQHSGSGGVQVFSVVQAAGRGSSAPQMGFVELVPTDTAIATGDGATLLTRINLGRCFLPSCQQGQNSRQNPARSASAPSAQSHAPSPHGLLCGRAPSPDSVCAHIRRATECQNHATPLTVKSSVLDALQVSLQTRAELWRLATESSGPLVQRVSKDTLVVKCHAGPDHPLGLLHVTTGGATEPPEASKAEAKGSELPHIRQAGFHCTCQVNGRRGKAATDGTNQPGSRKRAAGSNSTTSATTSEPCLHFYACVCAFASDDKMDFDCSGLINYNFNDVHQSSESRLFSAPDKIQHLSGHPDDLQHNPKRHCMDHSVTASTVVLPVGLGAEVTPLPVGLGSEVTSLSVGLGSEAVSPPSLRKAVQRKLPHHPFMMKSPGSSQAVDEHNVSMGFHQWLAGVTERIHQTMHYQFDGKPEALVYHIPQEFFNALQHRLSLGSKKRRLPNTTTAFVRNDSLPLGSFSKYTWNITNLMQVKRIFDTPQMPLELTQSFVKNMDGSYSPFHHPDCPADPLRPDRAADPQRPDGSRTDRPLAIRPMELRTFLKVGTFTADQKEATPFVIEWIPDVLPRSRVGELRIRLEFGHEQSGGPAEHGAASNPRRNGGAQSSGTNSNKMTPAVSIQPPHSQPVEVLQIVL